MNTAALDKSLIFLISKSKSLFILSEIFSIAVFINSNANKKKYVEAIKSLKIISISEIIKKGINSIPKNNSNKNECSFCASLNPLIEFFKLKNSFFTDFIINPKPRSLKVSSFNLLYNIYHSMCWSCAGFHKLI